MHRAPLLLVAISACTPFTEDRIAADDGGTGLAPDDGAGSNFAAVDAGADDGAFAPGCNLDASFGLPTLMPPVASAGVEGVRFSADALTVYFAAPGPNEGPMDLFVATRATRSAPFNLATLLLGDGFNPSDNDSDPSVSGDGLTLVFARTEGESLIQHLYSTTRATPDAPFAEAGLIPNVNALQTVDQQPYLRLDGEVLYFASSRFADNLADVYRATWNGTSFDPPARVDELDVPAVNDYFPVVTADDRTIYFASGRPDPSALGGDDIWMATRDDPSEPFAPPVDVTVLNTDGTEIPSYVTPDGCVLYFASTRGRTPLQMYVATKPSR